LANAVASPFWLYVEFVEPARLAASFEGPGIRQHRDTNDDFVMTGNENASAAGIIEKAVDRVGQAGCGQFDVMFGELCGEQLNDRFAIGGSGKFDVGGDLGHARKVPAKTLVDKGFATVFGSL